MKVAKEKKDKITKTTIRLLDWGQGIQLNRWEIRCVDHNKSIHAQTKNLAMAHYVRPAFCEQCHEKLLDKEREEIAFLPHYYPKS
jgi:uncharacterized protein YqeY